jgi:hypothetical protein
MATSFPSIVVPETNINMGSAGMVTSVTFRGLRRG